MIASGHKADTTDTSEPLPCPFCGCGSCYPDSEQGTIPEHFVHCPNCLTHGPIIFRHHRSADFCDEQAIYAWNRRAS